MENKETEVEVIDYEKEYKELQVKYKKMLSAYNRIKTSNEIVVDLSNEDNRKTVRELMEQGKILVNKADNKPFIVAQQNSPIYDGAVSPVSHKIYIDDIKVIIVKRYYEDYEIVDKGNRKFIKQVIWCYHNGYNVSSTLSEKDLVYLYGNNLIDKSKVKYSDVDASTGSGYASKAEGVTIEEAMKERDYREKQHKKQTNIGDSEPEEKEVVVKEVKEPEEKEVVVKEVKEPKIEETVKVDEEPKEEVVQESVTESFDISDVDFGDIDL